MMTRNERIHAFIHAASLGAAGVGGGMAQVPGADAPVIASIQTAMIISIAKEYDVALTDAAAIDLLGTATATFAGRTVSQLLVGWIPGLGNVINACTAAGITEALGWWVDDYFASKQGGASFS